MKIKTPEKQVEAEVADTAFKRAKGLSLRAKGKMLFIFSGKTKAPIDMMLMRDSLYLYFLDSGKKVMHAEKAFPWYKFPEKFLHRPEESYRYLLESFEDLGLEEGDSVKF